MKHIDVINANYNKLTLITLLNITIIISAIVQNSYHVAALATIILLYSILYTEIINTKIRLSHMQLRLDIHHTSIVRINKNIEVLIAMLNAGEEYDIQYEDQEEEEKK